VRRVLFVTWDGPGQAYLQSLFLPIFARVAEQGYAFSVLQFRWGDAVQADQARVAAEAYGVEYRAVEIARRPKALGALATVAWGAALLRRELRKNVDVVMPRSILPAMLVNACSPRQPVLFDADGLPADERVEFGNWSSSGAFYRVWREVEAQALRRAAAVLTRTEASREILLARAGPTVPAERIVVAPNGKDEQQFSPTTPEARVSTRRQRGVPEHAPWLVYVGSIGPQYCLPDLLAFYDAVRQRMPETRLTILTGQEREASDALGNRPPALRRLIDVGRVRPDEVPAYLAAADLGLALRTPSFSQRAVSPIKVGEYLLCGLPVLSDAGVGDLDLQVPSGIGFLLRSRAPEALDAAAVWFAEQVLPRRDELRQACRSAGLAHFSLAHCAERYSQALNSCFGPARALLAQPR
jgi:glycosyltransferase involved in cell wall biosynthesis